MKTLNILGCGRAASCLASLFHDAGCLRIGDVLNRSRASSDAAVGRVGSGRAIDGMAEFQAAELWMIGTGDDQVMQAAEDLAESGRVPAGSVVFHLAGRYSPDVLSLLDGCEHASVHPVRSLGLTPPGLEDFAGTACLAEGSREALGALQPAFAAIGASWLTGVNLDRGLYHASVSIISNITKAVAWKAEGWLQEAGLERESAVEITHKLLASTMDDLQRSGARHSITGPIVRGDTSTVEAHLAALASLPAADSDIYRVLARAVLDLAEERGDLDHATLQRFSELLHPAGA